MHATHSQHVQALVQASLGTRKALGVPAGGQQSHSPAVGGLRTCAIEPVSLGASSRSPSRNNSGVITTVTTVACNPAALQVIT